MPPTDRRPVKPLLRAWGRGPVDPLPLALAGREDGVHDVRVAARRLRAVLPVLLRRPERARVREVIRLLRRLGDAAAPTRDLDVIGGLLAGDASLDPGVSTLLERLCAARRTAWRGLRDTLNALDLSAVQGAIGAVAAEDPEPLFVVLARVGHLRDQLARDIAARLRAAGRFRPDALHRLRIRVRRLRYLAEMEAEIRGLPPVPATRLKEVQGALGRVQDAWVVSRWLLREASLARRRGARDLDLLARKESRRWMETAREHHRAFLSLGPAALVQDAVRALGSRSSRLSPTRPRPRATV
jgi:CHAD domain-containing protein